MTQSTNELSANNFYRVLKPAEKNKRKTKQYQTITHLMKTDN